MFTSNPQRKSIKQLVVLAVFSVCMVAAQFSALQHSIHHPFHGHTHLCDSFISFEHSSESLTQSIALLISLEKISTPYATETQAAFHGKSNTFRIRGPPSLLI